MNVISSEARWLSNSVTTHRAITGFDTGKGSIMGKFISKLVNSLKQGIGFLPTNDSQVVANKIIAGYEPSAEFRGIAGLERKRVGILYADIVDYSRLTEDDEEGTHQRLVESMGIAKAHVIANNGRIAHFAGDAILIEFKDADSALHCAINMQLSIRQWNAGLDPGKQIRFRIGVNFGEVIEDRGDIYGKAVNLAARIEGLAHSGGICVSKSARENLSRHSRIRFTSLGKRYLKNIHEPVEVFWIQIAGDQGVKLNKPGPLKISPASS